MIARFWTLQPTGFDDDDDDDDDDVVVVNVMGGALFGL